MMLTKEQIEKLPIVAEDEGMFYRDGELESVLLSDFKKDADKIDVAILFKRR